MSTGLLTAPCLIPRVVDFQPDATRHARLALQQDRAMSVSSQPQ